MTFYVDGPDDPNPTLRLRPGEQVRVRSATRTAACRTTSAFPRLGVGTRRRRVRSREVRRLHRARETPRPRLTAARRTGDDAGTILAREVKWQDRFSSPDSKRRYVRPLFSTIADRYDLITVLLSDGPTAGSGGWSPRSPAPTRMRQRSISPAAPATSPSRSRPRAAASSASTSRRAWSSSRAASRQRFRHDVSFVTGDMMALPFPDATFDVVTTGYGTAQRAGSRRCAGRDPPRAAAGRAAALARLRPPTNRVVRGVYLAYLTPSARRSGSVASRRSRHLSLHSRVDSPLSRSGRRLCARQNGWVRQVHPSAGARRFPGDALGHQVTLPAFRRSLLPSTGEARRRPQPAILHVTQPAHSTP